MKRLNININHKNNLAITVTIFSLYFIFFLFNVSLSYFIITPVRAQIVSNTFNGSLFAVNVAFFQNNAVAYMVIVYMLYSRLSSIRRYLNALDSKSHEMILPTLNEISFLVDKICDTLDLMKICYTIKLLGYVLHFTFYTVLGIYGYLSYFYNSSPSYLDLAFCSMTLMWEIYYAPFFIWILVFSNLIEREGEKIEMSAHNISEKFPGVKIIKRVNLIAMQCHHRRLLIECGVYVIDWKLLFVMFGSVYSFLLIIIQFEFNNI